MARIIIASPASGQLEVEQSAFDAGFFPGYVYVRDAGPAASAEPSVEEVRVAGFVNGGGPLSTALRAAFVSSSAVRQVVALTQSAYAALTPDPNTLYVITGGTIVTTASGTPTSSLVDAFTSTTGLWTVMQGAASISGGNLDLTVPYPDYTIYRSVSAYDLRSSSLAVKVAQLPGPNYSSDFGLYFGTATNQNCLALSWEAGTVYFQYYNGTTKSTVGSFAVNLSTDSWWRLRHDGSTVYWETGGDGVSYTTRGSLTAASLTWVPNNGTAFLSAGYYDNGQAAPTSHALVAGVNAS